MKDKVAARHHIDGEMNSRFDYEINKLKKPRNTIDSLQKPGSNPPIYTTRTPEMLRIATDYHEALQQDSGGSVSDSTRAKRIEEVTATLRTRLRVAERDNLDRGLTETEIEEAMRQVPNDKAPGLDGIPIELWKLLNETHQASKLSETPTANIVGMMKVVFDDIDENGVHEDSGFADGWMCPLYKKKARTDIANYRPITVLNTDYKVLTKALTNRLTEVVPDLIHEDQAGFMKNRSIFDQTELIHLTMTRCEDEDVEGMILCLDQEKAYDKIHHDFLWESLTRLGFPPRFIRVVKHLYGSAITKIIINGHIGNGYRIIRGVRQGDPLSCLLFNIAIESLAEMIRQSEMQGIKLNGMEKKLMANLFADDTTVFLDRNDDLTLLLVLLERWCQASGAKFNIDKTVIIPLGNETYRKLLHDTRRPNAQSDPIPETMYILPDKEPTRILGSFYGYGVNDLDVWQPTIEKVKVTLQRWGQYNPSIVGRCKAASAIVGSYTQVQGMPEKALRELHKAMDDFVYAKGGERKTNAISLEVLKADVNHGGLGLIDVKARNEAIELMKLKAYLGAGCKRPLWAYVADTLIRKATTSDFRLIREEFLDNPFTQRWRVNPKALPPNIQRLIRTAKKYNTQDAPLQITALTQSSQPFWYTLHRRAGTQTRYNDTWGSCQRATHSLKTVGQMLDHADKNRHLDHRNTQYCDCVHCYNDRTLGCPNPIMCRRNADKKLDTLEPSWDPRNTQKVSEAPSPRADDITDGEVWIPYQTPQEDPEQERVPDFRVLVNWKKTDQPTAAQLENRSVHSPRWHKAHTVVWTDGSCTNNGTGSAVAGSGVWYGRNDPRNRMFRLPNELASNNAGELAAILSAIRENRETKVLTIITDSQYSIDALVKHLPRWAKQGFTSNSNSEILAALYAEILSSDTQIRLRKVKGHSGDEGNDGADALAAAGASKQTPDALDLTAGEHILNMGIDLSSATQSILYKALRKRAPKPTRVRTQRNIARIQNAIDENTGCTPKEAQIWSSILRSETLGKKSKALLWRSIHEGNKVGKYWEHTSVADDFMPCKLCDVPEESMNHILFECRGTGQSHVWSAFEEIWARTNWTKPFVSLGLALGITLAEVKDDEGKVLTCATRLFRILTSEAILTIWRLRCEWRIGENTDPTKIHAPTLVRARWLAAINKWLRLDRILTNRKSYGARALKTSTVAATWTAVLDGIKDNEVPDNWAEMKGVLVGIGRNKRPPGRNR